MKHLKVFALTMICAFLTMTALLLPVQSKAGPPPKAKVIAGTTAVIYTPATHDAQNVSPMQAGYSLKYSFGSNFITALDNTVQRPGTSFVSNNELPAGKNLSLNSRALVINKTAIPIRV